MRLPKQKPNDFPARSAALLAATVLAVAVLVACGQQSSGPVETAALPAEPAIAAADVSALLATLIHAGEPGAVTRQLAALPAVTPTSEVSVSNLHRPRQLDTISTLRYAGVEVEVYHVSATATPLLKSVRIEREDIEFRGLRVGMSAATARNAVGDATPLLAEGAETYWLALDAAAPVQVTLHVASGELEAFTVHAYLD